MPGCASPLQDLPSDIGEVHDEFSFCKDRKLDPFRGKRVRMRGARPEKWYTNDLHSANPELVSVDRKMNVVQSSSHSVSYFPVTAVDFCSIDTVPNFGGEQCRVLGKKDAWKEAEDALEEHSLRARYDQFNRYRRSKDILFEVPIIGHVIVSHEREEQQATGWPVLNGKA